MTPMTLLPMNDYSWRDLANLAAQHGVGTRRRQPDEEGWFTRKTKEELYADLVRRLQRNRHRNDDITCAICLNDMRNNGRNSQRLPCRHRYHTQCIEEALRRTGRLTECPMCRQPSGIPPAAPLEQPSTSLTPETFLPLNSHEYLDFLRRYRPTLSQAQIQAYMDSLDPAFR